MEEKCSKEEAREVFENDPETVSLSPITQPPPESCGFPAEVARRFYPPKTRNGTTTSTWLLPLRNGRV